MGRTSRCLPPASWTICGPGRWRVNEPTDTEWGMVSLPAEHGGTRQGKVVLVEHRDIADADTNGHYTVKAYESTKEIRPDGTWRHTSVILKPDTNMPDMNHIFWRGCRRCKNYSGTCWKYTSLFAPEKPKRRKKG